MTCCHRKFTAYNSTRELWQQQQQTALFKLKTKKQKRKLEEGDNFEDKKNYNYLQTAGH